MINYTNKLKNIAKNKDNYTDNLKRNTSKDPTSCYFCLFVGENEMYSKERLCAKHPDEIVAVKGCGTCSKGKSCFKWYNRFLVSLTPITNMALKASGFNFKNR